MNKLSVIDVDVAGKQVLVRVDFNVPLNNEGEITDDRRIRASLPTIQHILGGRGKAILVSHLGRPKGNPSSLLSLRPVAKRLSKLIGKAVFFEEDCIGDGVEKTIKSMQNGDCLLLENLRFHIGEEKNDPEFSQKLSKWGDFFVNDAFGTAHRAHASTEGVSHYFDTNVAGLLMEKEMDYLGRVLDNPEKPFVLILGGAKISDKLDLIQNFLKKVDKLLIGGGMVFTFLKAKGLNVGNSLVEETKIENAKEVLRKAGMEGVTFLLPSDIVIAKGEEVAPEIASAERKVVEVNDIPDGWIGLDIGPLTRRIFLEALIGAKTVCWNGPVGVFEIDPFSEGTLSIAKALARDTEKGVLSVLGGGDTGAACEKLGLSEKMSHISTGGGASLEYLSGKKLPGIAVLNDR
jgi:phosphoglycerate kinase